MSCGEVVIMSLHGGGGNGEQGHTDLLRLRESLEIKLIKWPAGD